MKRRVFLATTGAAVSGALTGCSDVVVPRSRGGIDEITPTTGTPVELGPECGRADQPLSAILTDDPGDDAVCFDGATPSLAIENERDERLTASVELEGAGSFAETYALDAGERIVESGRLEVNSTITGTIHIDEEYPLSWPARSCRRHGIAVTSRDISIGWVEPMRGPGDTQHDCYAGDPAPVIVRSEGQNRELTVTVTDRCSEAVTSDTVSLDADSTERLESWLTHGGRYAIEIATDGDIERQYEFDDACWGVEIVVDAAGEIHVWDIAID